MFTNRYTSGRREGSGRRVNIPVSNTGTVSLLMSFIVLCLASFAILSLSSRVSDRDYARRLADNQQKYYAAQSIAWETIASINASDGQNDVDPNGAAPIDGGQNDVDPNGIRKYNLPAEIYDCTEDVNEEGDPVITFAVPIDEDNALMVKLTGNIYSKNDNYTVLSFRKVRTTPWQEDDSIRLWGNE